jgi:hypothetical protein
MPIKKRQFGKNSIGVYFTVLNCLYKCFKIRIPKAFSNLDSQIAKALTVGQGTYAELILTKTVHGT